MARLNCYVHVHKDGENHAFGPADDVPAWARELITNPDVWDNSGESTPPVEDDLVVASGGVESDGPPPKAGQGASRARWAEYAEANGVAVSADAKREDIIAACEAAGAAVD